MGEVFVEQYSTKAVATFNEDDDIFKTFSLYACNNIFVLTIHSKRFAQVNSRAL